MRFLSILSLGLLLQPAVWGATQNVRQNVRTIRGLSIRGTTPVGKFSALLSFELDPQGRLAVLKISPRNNAEKDFEKLARAGMHISRYISVKRLLESTPIIEIKDLKYKDVSIPISGSLVSAKLSDFDSNSGGTMTLTYEANMISKQIFGDTRSVELKLRSQLIEFEGSNPARYWYIESSDGTPSDEIIVTPREWKLPAVGSFPVGVESLDVHQVYELDDKIEAFRRDEKLQRTMALIEEKKKASETMQRYSRMSAKYYENVLSKLPKDHPARAEFLRVRKD